MWEALKNAVTGVKDMLGIEVPELPVPGDLGAAAGDALTGAQEAVTGVGESATGAVEEVTNTGETLTGEAAGQVTDLEGRLRG